MHSESLILAAEKKLFFKRWLSKPGQLGTLAPISQSLAQAAAQAVFPYVDPQFPLVELGAGTGRLTRALISAGVSTGNITAIELDAALCQFLQMSLPDLNVVEGDAGELPRYLPEDIHGQLPVIVSVLPLLYMPLALRLKIVEAVFKALRPGGHFFHVTYSPISPLRSLTPSLSRSIQCRPIIRKWMNLPPGFVWHYV